MPRRFYLASLIAAALLSACAAQRPAEKPSAPAPAPAAALVKLHPGEYPALMDGGDPLTLAGSVRYSLDYLSKLPPEKTLHFGQEEYLPSELIGQLSAFEEFLRSGPSAGLVKAYTLEHFDVYASAGHDGLGTVLFTGYYTPELAASPAPDDTFRYPLYALPDDLIKADLGLFREKYRGEKLAGMVKGREFVPFYSRGEIEEGRALSGRGLELAWCADPVEVFFLQIQGSGVLVFPDGTRRHANYGGANGRPYRSIGKLLVEQGRAELGEMSMDFLKKYLRERPDEAVDVLNYNESYVFFRLEDAGPYGCLGEPVTDERSIATDASVFPPGALAFVETEFPVSGPAGEVAGWEPYSRFVMNQDTGGAIKGPGRVDVYFGSGETARFRAGHMRREGRLYFLAGKR
ncbi:MAG TPA: MltA domain-containing protein [Nitrospirota bacterium]|nr:MltA domain-containing protein [Nitrospirota bacterium]